jgi:uncharacterized protein (TIGR00255 family)
MTGFGTGKSESAGALVRIDVKTVNHKYLDLHVRLPAEHQGLEATIRKAVSERLARGRVDVTVSVERARSQLRIEADSDFIGAYLELVRSLQRQFPITGELSIESITRVPGAIRVSAAEASEEEDLALVAQVENAVEQALSGVVRMRALEGEALRQDLSGRLAVIRESLGVIGRNADVLVAHYRERLVKRVGELAPSITLDSGRLEMEALIYADKSDIAEEITRLASHLDQFEAALGQGEEAGKRLDFLLQEMNREVTTILSKSSGLNQSAALIGEAAIRSKVEIDKLREQVQNVE